MNIAGFYPDSIANGEGWRAVLFVSGCPHRCLGCHNPNTWDHQYGEPYNEQDIFAKITENPLLDGLTLSGGEPLLYYKQLTSLVRRVKASGLNIWAYTGYTFEDILKRCESNKELEQFVAFIDVLVDGRFEIEKRNLQLRFCGSSNQRIINIPVSLQKGQAVLYQLTS